MLQVMLLAVILLELQFTGRRPSTLPTIISHTGSVSTVGSGAATARAPTAITFVVSGLLTSAADLTIQLFRKQQRCR